MDGSEKRRSSVDVDQVRRKLIAGSDHHLWDDAKNRFQTEFTPDDRWAKKSEEFSEFLASTDSVYDARDFCVQLHENTDNKYSNREVKVRGRTLVGRDCVKKTMGNMESFLQLVDKGMGASETISLPWACVRFVLNATIQDSANFALWASAAEAMSRILVTCKTLGKLYSVNSDYANREISTPPIVCELLKIIPDTYYQILAFSWCAKIQSRKRAPRRMLGLYNPFSNNYSVGKAAFDAITDNAVTMSRISMTAFQEISQEVYKTLLDGQGDAKLELERISTFLRDSEAGVISAVKEQGHKLELAISQLNKPLDQYESDRAQSKHVKMALDPTNYSRERYVATLRERQPGTCRWILDLPQYKEWQSSNTSDLLWLHGDAGLGKSVLVSTVIEDLQQSQKDTILAYFYCVRLGQTAEARSSSAIRRSFAYSLYKRTRSEPAKLAEANRLIKQLLVGDGFNSNGEPRSIKDAAGKDMPASVLNDVFVGLAKILKQPIFLVLDALDECIDALDTNLLDTFTEWSKAAPIKILISSRPNDDERVAKFREHHTEIDVKAMNAQDVKAKAHNELTQIVSLSSSERRKVLKRVVDKAQGQFTYVNIAMSFFRRPWRRPIETVLEKLSDNVNSIYQQALLNVDQHYSDLARMSLKWALLRQGPLTVEELNDAYSGRFVVGGSDSESSSEDESSSDESADMSLQLKGGKLPHQSPDGMTHDRKAMKSGHAAAVRIFREQIETAAKTFLSVDGQAGILRDNHQSVRDCFLSPISREERSSSPRMSRDAASDGDACPHCSNCNSGRRDFQVYPEDHLEIAMTLIRHLRSPEFRREIYVHQVSPEPDEAPQVTGTATAGQSGTGTAAEGDASTSAEVTDPPKAKDDAEDARIRGIRKYLNEAINDPVLHVYEYPETEDEMASGTHIDVPPVKAQIDASRYEVNCWPLHLRAAEESLGPEAPSTALWEAVINELQAFFDDDIAWRSWRLNYGKSFATKTADRSISTARNFTPLHAAVVFGLTWVVKWLVTAKPELCSQQAIWGRHDDVMPLHLLHILEKGEKKPDINKRPELVDAILQGTRQNLTKFDNDAAKRKFLNHFPMLFACDPNAIITTKILDFVESMNFQLPLISLTQHNPLHVVAIYGTHPEVIGLLVRHGVDINLVDKGWGHTPLFWYFQGGTKSRHPILEALLQNGAMVNEESAISRMPLAYACDLRDAEGVTVMLKHKPEFEDADTAGLRAVHHAAKIGELPCLKHLIEAGAEVNPLSKEDDTPFSLACAVEDDSAAAHYLLDLLLERGFPPDQIDQASKINKTPLRRACWRGHDAMVKRLLSIPEIRNKRMSFIDHRRGRGIVHAAAQHGNADTIRLLVEYGADVGVKDWRGKSPLDVCCQTWPDGASYASYEETILLLLELHPASARDQPLMLHYAASKGSLALAKKLLSLNITNTSYRDAHGWTALTTARHYRHPELVNLLSTLNTPITGALPTRLTATISATPNPVSNLQVLKRNRRYDVHAILANHPIPHALPEYYFELTIGPDPSYAHPIACIGLTSFTANTKGWAPGIVQPGTRSAAYHNDDTWFHYYSAGQWRISHTGHQQGVPGDTLGCGYLAESGLIYFTRNGELFYTGALPLFGRLFPAVGKSWSGSFEGVNFGEREFVFAGAEEKRRDGRLGVGVGPGAAGVGVGVGVREGDANGVLPPSSSPPPPFGGEGEGRGKG